MPLISLVIVLLCNVLCLDSSRLLCWQGDCWTAV